MLTWLISVVIVLLSLALYLKNNHKRPPGPIGVPLLGYMPFLDSKYMHKSIEKLRQRYGPVFSLQLGSWYTVFISDYDLIKKAFQLQSLSSRPPHILFEFFSHEGHGLISSDGKKWQEQRRFALRHLRDLGMGKSVMEEHIIQEAQAMGDIFRSKAGQPTDLSYDLNISVVNIVWALVAGKRMKYDDPFFLGLLQAVNNNLQVATRVGIAGFLPWLAKCLPKKALGIDAIERSRDDFESYAKKEIEEHKKTFDPDNVRDFIDYFLLEMQKQTDAETTFTDTQLLVSIGDLFAAGGETTATTLRWAILLLSKFPDVQGKIRDEIDRIVGRERTPCLDDRSRMPYTDAVIHEVQRFADIAPIGIFHYTNADVEIGGFEIPKGTMVSANMRHVHRNPKYWSKPDEFYPEHFLDDDGNLAVPSEGFIPFSVGKRQCLGENLARLELFVFLSYFFQQFEFTLAPESKYVSVESRPNTGIVMLPELYKVIIQPR